MRCIVEVGFLYPDKVHNYHGDFPRAPTEEIQFADLSNWDQLLAGMGSAAEKESTKKLVQTLLDKKY